ncbi:MAG TPA: hypothetical protein VID47_12145, partial [Actinomycetota bacterium]
QLAPLLGLPEPSGLDTVRMAWDLAALCDAWAEAAAGVPEEIVGRPMPLSTPDPSRTISVRDLVVNVFHPIALLPGAWSTGGLPWYPEERDEEIATGLPDADAVASYAEAGRGAWNIFMLDRDEDELAERNPTVSSPRGTVRFDALVASQRWHAAFHYRQLLYVLDGWGYPVPAPLDLATIAGLDLPAEIM